MITPRQLEAALSEGLPPSEIAKAHKIPVISVYQLANRYGLNVGGCSTGLSPRPELLKCIKEGLTSEQAAKRAKCSQQYADYIYMSQSLPRDRSIETQVKRIRELIALGRAPSWIGNSLRLSTAQVKRIMAEHSIEWTSMQGRTQSSNAERIRELYRRNIPAQHAANLVDCTVNHVRRIYKMEREK